MTSLFSVPDREKNYQGYMVYVLSITWTLVICGIVSLGFYFFPQIWWRWLTFFFVSLVIGFKHIALNHYGHTRLASWSLTIMLWLLITIPCYSAGGIMAPGVLSQMSIVLTAGFLLGWRGGVLFALLSLGADLWLVHLELTGQLPVPEVLHNPFTRWLGVLIPFGTIVALQYFATNHMRFSIQAAQREIAKRSEAEALKDKTLYSLGERVKELKTLYAVSRILRDERTAIGSLFKEIANALPAGWQYPEITAARVCFADTWYESSNYQSSAYCQQASMNTTNGTKVCIEVVYLKEMPEEDEGPFLKEERNLIDMLVEMLKIYVERRERTAELLEYKYALDEAAIVSIADVNACFTHVNDNFCAVSKYTRSELLGKHHSIIWSGHHPPEYFDELKMALQSGDPFTGDFCNVAKDGTLYWVNSTIVPFLNENGKVYQYLSINYDITERKKVDLKLLTSEASMRHIMNSALDAIVCMNPDGIITFWTPKCEAAFGWTAEEAIGKQLSNLIVPERYQIGRAHV